MVSDAQKQVENLSDDVIKGLKIDDLGEKANELKNNVQSKMTGFAMPAVPSFNFENDGTKAGKEFMESDTIISKFVFIFLLFIVFILLLKVFSKILLKFLTPSKNPILLDGLLDGRKPMTISVNPNSKDSIPIYRSKNEIQGVEFTWNYWLFIDDVFYGSEKMKHVFHKGERQFSTNTGEFNGINYPNNAPGVYLAEGIQDSNKLYVFFNTYNNVLEHIIIEDIPIEKWLCVTMRCQNQTIDVYINGVLTKRHILSGVPKQNYSDVHISQNGGFGGYLSSLRYFNYAINTNKIMEINRKGPNLKMIGGNIKVFPPYLRTKWFYTENKEYS